MNQTKDYVDAVLNGSIVAGKKIKLAAKRHLNDLARSKDKKYLFYFDNEEAENAIRFIESLPKTDGTALQMAPFQKWIIGELYGWREKETHNRRYDRAFISMARKNSKTYLASGMAANGLLREKQPAKGRQVLFVSNALKQAKLGYDMLASSLNQIRKQSVYMRRRIKVQKQAITDLASDSKAVALAADTSTLDGYAGTTIILDEWHESKTREVYNVLKSGMAQEKNGLLAIVSTSGLNLNVPMYEEYKMLSKVLTGTEKADRYFIAIYELDDKEEVFDQSKWEKANPLLCEPTVKNKMIENIQSDVDLAVKQNTLIPVLVKNFNMWQQAEENSYIAADDWQQGTIATPPKITKRDIYLGVDLSKSNDLTSVSWIIPTGNNKFYCDSHSWVGTKYGLDTKIKRDGIDYLSLERAGECSITKLDSGVIDYDDIFNYVTEFIETNQLNVKALAFDPWNFNALLTKFEKLNYPLIEVRQGTKTLNTPTRTFREQLFAGNIQHSSNKLLAYAVNNAILKYDNSGVQIDKARNANRIDPLAALMNAYVTSMDYYENEVNHEKANSFYKSKNFDF
ncbi:terminase large subunit [Loigolactobacillus backii]|uniref:terminase large subunit n=1 Tax=Loigolactobacillus backii TaxID=375175 RepID=UPI000C1CBAFC|nr:terminase TerL endonuclease subunit [Loigolactobacillus backii]MDA5388778.1 terminase large subunit [Loigolactobacillus backii]MDA5391267.1 terminase large subunit [Loigolactobacillus backii]PIO83793.1 terminase [Loigolactobacillus backii]